MGIIITCRILYSTPALRLCFAVAVALLGGSLAVGLLVLLQGPGLL